MYEVDIHNINTDKNFDDVDTSTFPTFQLHSQLENYDTENVEILALTCAIQGGFAFHNILLWHLFNTIFLDRNMR